MATLCTCASSCSMNSVTAAMKIGMIMEMGGPTEVPQADTLDAICPFEATINCMADVSACTAGAPPEEVTAVVEALSGCASDWAPRPIAVAVTMEITVANPQEFVQNPASERAVAGGIASAANVAPSKVSARLSVARRLQESGRRLQQGGGVNVDATIEADDASGVAALESSVSAIPTDTMASSLTTALGNAGIQGGVTVASMSAAPAPPPVREETLAALPDFTQPSGGSSGGEPPENDAASALRVSSAFFIATVMMIGM